MEESGGFEEVLESDLGRRFIGGLARHGKKAEARELFSHCLALLSRRVHPLPPQSVLEEAVARRKASLLPDLKTIQVPDVRPEALAVFLRSPRLAGAAVHSILKAAGRRREKGMSARLAAEIYESHLGPPGPEGPQSGVQALRRRRA